MGKWNNTNIICLRQMVGLYLPAGSLVPLKLARMLCDGAQGGSSVTIKFESFFLSE
jgi:hypothetical protein